MFTIDPVVSTRRYEYHVQGNYGMGWETVFVASTPSEAREILSDYEYNEPEPHRIRKVRI